MKWFRAILEGMTEVFRSYELFGTRPGGYIVEFKKKRAPVTPGVKDTAWERACYDVRQARKEIARLQEVVRDCPHEVAVRHDHTHCPHCEMGFGWLCLSSPDRCCHYYSVEYIPDGSTPLPEALQVPVGATPYVIRLVTGELVPVPLSARRACGQCAGCLAFDPRSPLNQEDLCTQHLPYDEQDSKYETDDSCLYCGQPEERK